MRYRMSLDKSLWEWTPRGQRLLSAEDAVIALEKINTRQAMIMRDMVISGIPPQRKTMRDRLQTRSSKNWATLYD